MDDLSVFERSISVALANAGCDTYSTGDLRRETRELRDDIYADTVKHGGDIAEPFVSFVIVHGVAVYTFFDTDFSVYIFRCVESELIAQTSPLAMVDVEEHRRLLAETYGKDSPDAVLPRAAAELWLG